MEGAHFLLDQVLELNVRPGADGDFVICWKARMDLCLCYQVNV